MAFVSPLGRPTLAPGSISAAVARRPPRAGHLTEGLPRRRGRPQPPLVRAAAAPLATDGERAADGSGDGGHGQPSGGGGGDAGSGGAVRTPRLVIEYCPGCRWGLRAGWMAQELLVTFGTALGEVALQPSPTAGTFTITVDGVELFCRATQPGKGFPELKDIKRRLRDAIAPDASLGHTDRAAEGAGATGP